MTRRLTQIISYPVKSLGGICHRRARLTGRGLEYDRRWMLVDEHGRFLTIRQHPEFLFYALSMTDSGFRIQKKHDPDALEIPRGMDAGETISVEIWNDRVEALVADDTINHWFAEKTGIACRLVYLPDYSPRRVSPPEEVLGEHHVSFADGYPYLIVAEASVKDISSRVDVPIDFRRFRPNLVYEGGEAYEEFGFDEVSLGADARIKCVKPCVRCVVTTLNPDTGARGKEPLKTLYERRLGDRPVFGQNAVMLREGIVKTGDRVVLP